MIAVIATWKSTSELCWDATAPTVCVYQGLNKMTVWPTRHALVQHKCVEIEWSGILRWPYVPAYVPAFVPACIPAYVPACVPAYVPAYVPVRVPAYVWAELNLELF